MTSKTTSKPQQPQNPPDGFYSKLHFWNHWIPLIKMSYRLSSLENFHSWFFIFIQSNNQRRLIWWQLMYLATIGDYSMIQMCLNVHLLQVLVQKMNIQEDLAHSLIPNYDKTHELSPSQPLWFIIYPIYWVFIIHIASNFTHFLFQSDNQRGWFSNSPWIWP